MIFNDLSLKGVVGTGRRYVITDESRPGMSIKVSALGSASYYYRYKKHGERKEVPLGSDFEKALSLYENLIKSTAGDDATTQPEEVDNDRLFKPGINLQAVASAYYNEQVVGHLSGHSQKNYRSFLDDFTDWAKDNAPDLYYGRCNYLQGREAIKRYLLTLVRKTPILCNRVKSCLSSMCKWASRDRDLLRDNPVVNMPTGVEKPKGRRLEARELEVLLPLLEAGDWDERTKDALRLILLTLLRPGEVLGLRGLSLRQSLSQPGMWNLHLSDTKSGRPHLVPLSPQAFDIVSRNMPKGPNVATNARLFTTSTWGLRQVLVRACKRAGVTVCSPHDLRRTSATLCGELGIEPHLIPHLLNHAAGDVTKKHYMLHQFEAERRVALTKLAGFLDTKGL